MGKSENTPLLELRGVYKAYRVGGFLRKIAVNAIEDIWLSLGEADIISLVGESGCGKTTTGKVAVGLLKPDKGEVLYKGKNIWEMTKEEFKEFRRNVQMMHQDPYSSLNPMLTVYKTLSAPLFRHGLASDREDAVERIARLLRLVGLTPPEEYMEKYPHQLSGGERQRVAFARTLSLNPKLIVADEPVSMIDVSLRASILNLMLDMREKFKVSYVYITHDLITARYFSRKHLLMIMYLGSIVETGQTDRIIKEPLHPYTQVLLSALPEPDPRVTRSKKLIALRSLDVPSLLRMPTGCKFHPRCPFFKKGLCDVKRPKLIEVESGRRVACHLYGS